MSFHKLVLASYVFVCKFMRTHVRVHVRVNARLCFMCACASAHARVRVVCICVSACAQACARVCVRMCVCVCVCVCVCARACWRMYVSSHACFSTEHVTYQTVLAIYLSRNAQQRFWGFKQVDAQITNFRGRHASSIKIAVN